MNHLIFLNDFGSILDTIDIFKKPECLVGVALESASFNFFPF
ncbi:hypothetical protein LEP1GSC049_3932 [Leptospira kirschneri serovar Cynopteri str. 3522 CT]|nr:hypothetical protein LEP1GSC049_3932 [Leptospira kirschneri serovar Cynopteri str. 3522 CT]